MRVPVPSFVPRRPMLCALAVALFTLSVGCARSCGGDAPETPTPVAQPLEAPECRDARDALTHGMFGASVAPAHADQVAALRAEEASVDAWLDALVAARDDVRGLTEALHEADAGLAREVASAALMRRRADLPVRFAAARMLALGGPEGIEALAALIRQHEGGVQSERAFSTAVALSAAFPLASRDVLFGPGGLCTDLADQLACTAAAVELAVVDDSVLAHLQPAPLRALVEAEAAWLRGEAAAEATWEEAALASLPAESRNVLASLDRLVASGLQADALYRVRVHLLLALRRIPSGRQDLLRDLEEGASALREMQSPLTALFEQFEIDAQPQAVWPAALMVAAGLRPPEAAEARLRIHAGQGRGTTAGRAALALARLSGDPSRVPVPEGASVAPLVEAMGGDDPAALIARIESGEDADWVVVPAAMMWAGGRPERLVRAAVEAEVRRPVWLEIAGRLGPEGAGLTAALLEDPDQVRYLPARGAVHVSERLADGDLQARILGLLDDDDPQVALRALRVTVALGWGAASPERIAAVARPARGVADAELLRSARWGWALLSRRAWAQGAEPDLSMVLMQRREVGPDGEGFAPLGLLLHSAWHARCREP